MSMRLPKDKQVSELVFASFNQDYGCIACATQRGFCIFNSDPLKERFRRDFENGGIGIVEMLFRSNILGLVGSGTNPKFPDNKAMIWDDYQNKCIAELEFKSEVKAIKLRRDRIVVVLENKVYVYNFADLQLLHQIETSPNPKGLCALSASPNIVLAVPGLKPGTVHVELYDLKQTQIINAHNNGLTQLVLSLDGSKLATSSERGTLVRLWDTKTGAQTRELRRGADKADIYSLAFSSNLEWLCVSSDKGTVHIYGLSAEHDKREEENRKKNEEAKTRVSSFSFMKEILPSYFSSEWSFASFHIPETHSICCFGSDSNSVIVVSADGSYYKYSFDRTKGGECKQETMAKFLK
ncbi:WD repeat domain phosphoinositide-interacting protein 3 [Planoprotostelium fungivorum]|uniref:WD repeat domain phosphoinositide-interacting protein 3 n=1 Tax=Planoprotostelium fungivorum TaxID=1890364 RepID=A0A2P6NZM3_9EUKA|nr:WD repeat domain phosphoinositide-interacting protein 3 [Planoprotostelium fungivorum]